MTPRWLPTIPIHIGDWRADPFIHNLELAERCQVLELLMDLWVAGQEPPRPGAVAERAWTTFLRLAPAYLEVRAEHEKRYTECVEAGRRGGQESARRRRSDPTSDPTSDPQATLPATLIAKRKRVSTTPTPTPTPTPDTSSDTDSDEKKPPNESKTIRSPLAGGVVSKTLAVSPSKNGRETWLTPFWDDWEQRTAGGKLPGGQAAKVLKPLIDQHGEVEVRAAWRNYLTQTAPEFLSPARFGATYGCWTGQAGPVSKQAIISAQLRSDLAKTGKLRSILDD